MNMPSEGSLHFPGKPQHLALAGPVFRLGDALLEYPRFHLCVNPQYHSYSCQNPLLFQGLLPSCAVLPPVHPEFAVILLAGWVVGQPWAGVVQGAAG